MESLGGACRKLAAVGDGDEWCPKHGYEGSSLFGMTKSISRRAISPREGGEERAELCHPGLTEVCGLGVCLYTQEGVGEVREGWSEKVRPLPGSAVIPPRDHCQQLANPSCTYCSPHVYHVDPLLRHSEQPRGPGVPYQVGQREG